MRLRTLLSINLHHLSTDELRRLFSNWLNQPNQKLVVTPNSEILLLAHHDKEFAEILNHADLSLPDGSGQKFAAWFNGFNLTRHPGVDSLNLLIELCVQNNKKILFFGGKKENTETAASKMKEKFPNINVLTFDPGRVAADGKVDQTIIDQINQLAPDVLAVALGQRKQERFANSYLKQIPTVKIIIGIGGALDMISGNLPRAPKFLRRLGLEWFWRLVIEPSRWPRIVRAVIIFPIVVIIEKIKSPFTKKAK